jgi:uncharacterized protein (DUF58 family)
MPGALGPRFALEAGFLILLAVLLGFADLSPALIILIMALAWVLVSCIEYFAWRQGPRFPPRFASATQTGPGYVEEELVEERIAPTPPAPSPPVEEQTVVAPPPEPEPAPAEETTEEADKRVADARLAFEVEQRKQHRLEPLKPRPRRRWGLFGPRVRPGEESESRAEEQ